MSYERWLRSGDQSFYLLKQDKAAPPGKFPIIRGLQASSFGNQLNVTVNLYKSEPRRYPPMHFAETGAGLNINEEEVRLLRDTLDGWLAARERIRQLEIDRARDHFGFEGDDG